MLVLLMADLILKQARAVIDNRTTVVCLDVHGIIVPVDQPFETLAGDFMQPPFHVHCRTLVGPHMPGFIQQARRDANRELKTRPDWERRKGNAGPDPAAIPGPVTGNPPSGFSRRDEEASFRDSPGQLFTPKKTRPPADPWKPVPGGKKRVVKGKSFVKWAACWILPSLLKTLRDAAMRLPEDERDDVLGALVEVLAGKTVTALTQIPPRLLRALGLQA